MAPEGCWNIKIGRPDYSYLMDQPWELGQNREPVAYWLEIGGGKPKKPLPPRPPEPPTDPGPHGNPVRGHKMLVPNLPRGFRPGVSALEIEECDRLNYLPEDYQQFVIEDKRLNEAKRRKNRFEDIEWGSRATGFENITGTDPLEPYGADTLVPELKATPKPIRPGWGRPVEPTKYDKYINEWEERDIWKQENERFKAIQKRNRDQQRGIREIIQPCTNAAWEVNWGVFSNTSIE
ncbi:hypothetical protein GE061_006988 [Apolygus lucorum]|uniref:Uncharacterized protein n=1 Tax=Apolygus lucorum TaxID=248454 RepID=A0A8S9WU94_APOLU|nr:hypothetical protein GE061_006988 [Apolygus lucorum]